jgi:hypothetical protein
VPAAASEHRSIGRLTLACSHQFARELAWYAHVIAWGTLVAASGRILQLQWPCIHAEGSLCTHNKGPTLLYIPPWHLRPRSSSPKLTRYIVVDNYNLSPILLIRYVFIRQDNMCSWADHGDYVIIPVGNVVLTGNAGCRACMAASEQECEASAFAVALVP